MIKFGLITESDSRVLIKSLQLSWDNVWMTRTGKDRKLRVLEIGVCHGDTARGIKEFLDNNSIPFIYYGIDSERDRVINKPFPEANLFIGSSEKLYKDINEYFDLIFIDGCHCLEHTILDFSLYSDKIVTGGYVLFHDTSPLVQGRDYQGHGFNGEGSLDNYIAVRRGIEYLEMYSRKYWELIIDEQKEQGMMLFRRLY